MHVQLPSNRLVGAPQPARLQRGKRTLRGRQHGPRQEVRQTSVAGATKIVRRAAGGHWPSLPQRLGLALIAWLPIVVLAAYAGSIAPNEEIGMLLLMAVGLLALVAAPRLAYVGSVATLGLLVVGGLFIGGLAVAGIRLPLGTGLTAAVGGALVLGYVAIAGTVALGPSSLRPWSARDRQTVRSR